MPSLKEEKKLWKNGYKYVVGLDEAGRGCLAGPVVAAAVIILNPKFKALNPKQIQSTKFNYSKRVLNFDIVSNLEFRILNLKLRDSKKLSSKKREKLYKIITKNPQIKWAIGRVSEKVIDKINILEATKLAMKRAIKNLTKKLEQNSQKIHDREIFTKIDFLILDGNFKMVLPIPQKSIIKADERVFSCATSSILAKVYRDRIMQRYHQKYPRYGFDKHKGYPTKYHRKMLKKYGPCKIHRKNFRPVLEIVRSLH